MLGKKLLILILAGFVLSFGSVNQAQAQKVDPKKVETKKEEPKKLELRDDWPKVTGTLALVVAADAKKKAATVQTADGKKSELVFGKDAVFMGPRGGKAEFDDERFAAGRTVKIVYDASGKTVKEIHLQIMKAEDKKSDKK